MTTRPVLCAALVLLVVLAAAAIPASRIRIVIISLVQHSVQVRMPPPQGISTSSMQWTPALRNAPVIEGESIRTRSNGLAAVELECDSALRLTPGSELAFNRLRLDAKGIPVTTVTLAAGEAYFTMQKADSRDFRAHVGDAELSQFTGGASLRLDVPALQPASFEVLHGGVLLQVGGKSTQVKSKHRIELLPGGGFETLALARADRWQKWSHHLDQSFARALYFSRAQPPVVIVPMPDPSESSGEPVTDMGPTLGAINAIVAGNPADRALRPVPGCARR
ncbi:MAG: hypothetical protein ACRD04_00640 [Terriglobales bacterium]